MAAINLRKYYLPDGLGDFRHTISARYIENGRARIDPGCDVSLSLCHGNNYGYVHSSGTAIKFKSEIGAFKTTPIAP